LFLTRDGRTESTRYVRSSIQTLYLYLILHNIYVKIIILRVFCRYIFAIRLTHDNNDMVNIIIIIIIIQSYNSITFDWGALENISVREGIAARSAVKIKGLNIYQAQCICRVQNMYDAYYYYVADTRFGFGLFCL